jgi:hypothetical protein
MLTACHRTTVGASRQIDVLGRHHNDNDLGQDAIETRGGIIAVRPPSSRGIDRQNPRPSSGQHKKTR